MTSGINRRSFLKGAFAAGVATLTPVSVIAVDLPMIYGNGLDCDAAGISAMLSGSPYLVHKDADAKIRREGENVAIDGLNALIKSTISVGGRGGVNMMGEIEINVSEDFVGRYFIHIAEIENPVCLGGIHLIGNSSPSAYGQWHKPT